MKDYLFIHKDQMEAFREAINKQSSIKVSKYHNPDVGDMVKVEIEFNNPGQLYYLGAEVMSILALKFVRS